MQIVKIGQTFVNMDRVESAIADGGSVRLGLTSGATLTFDGDAGRALGAWLESLYLVDVLARAVVMQDAPTE